MTNRADTPLLGQRELFERGNPRTTPLDWRRMTNRRDKIRAFMLEHRGYCTLTELRQHVGGSDTGNSAALRALRRPQFGGHPVLRRRVGDGDSGLWAYAVLPATSPST